jgi:hypothetical protein
VVGLGLIAGSLVDRRAPGRVSLNMVVTAAVLYAVSHAWSVFAVQRAESNRTDVGLDPDWLTLPGPALIVVTLMGAAAVIYVPVRQLRCSTRRATPSADDAVSDPIKYQSELNGTRDQVLEP